MSALRRYSLIASVVVGCALGVLGCKSPDKANILLRKQNAELRDKFAASDRARAGDRATIESLQSQRGTLPMLPQDRLDRLFTVHGIEFGRLTGSSENGINVYITPTDDAGDTIKAAGAFTIDLFDLDNAKENRIGHWEFDVQKSRAAWFGNALLNCYVLECAWQTAPRHKDLTVRVTFKDELTQRTFIAQREIKLSKLPATRP